MFCLTLRKITLYQERQFLMAGMIRISYSYTVKHLEKKNIKESMTLMLCCRIFSPGKVGLKGETSIIKVIPHICQKFLTHSKKT